MAKSFFEELESLVANSPTPLNPFMEAALKGFVAIFEAYETGTWRPRMPMLETAAAPPQGQNAAPPQQNQGSAPQQKSFSAASKIPDGLPRIEKKMADIQQNPKSSGKIIFSVGQGTSTSEGMAEQTALLNAKSLLSQKLGLGEGAKMWGIEMLEAEYKKTGDGKIQAFVLIAGKKHENEIIAWNMPTPAQPAPQATETPTTLATPQAQQTAPGQVPKEIEYIAGQVGAKAAMNRKGQPTISVGNVVVTFNMQGARKWFAYNVGGQRMASDLFQNEDDLCDKTPQIINAIKGYSRSAPKAPVHNGAVVGTTLNGTVAARAPTHQHGGNDYGGSRNGAAFANLMAQGSPNATRLHNQAMASQRQSMATQQASSNLWDRYTT